MSPFRALGGVSEGAVAIREFNDTAIRFSTVVEGLPDQIRWQSELLLFDLESRDATVRALAAGEALAESANRMTAAVDALPDNVALLLEELSDSPASYLHRAAVNAALDIVRSRQAARSTALEHVEGQLTGVVENEPDKQHAASEMRTRIRAELAKMSPKSAEIFVLRYFEGYGNHEIARMLGTSRSTVNVILHRTREKLKVRIGETGEGQ